MAQILLSYLLLSSVQQVSELVMTIQKPVDVDSGKNSLLASVASVQILGIAILTITTYVSHFAFLLIPDISCNLSTFPSSVLSLWN